VVAIISVHCFPIPVLTHHVEVTIAMNRLTHRIRKPVKRQSAEHYVLLILLSFAASVTLTRFFLQLTGYPQ
jgi:hypothetical protein